MSIDSLQQHTKYFFPLFNEPHTSAVKAYWAQRKQAKEKKSGKSWVHQACNLHIEYLPKTKIYTRVHLFKERWTSWILLLTSFSLQKIKFLGEKKKSGQKSQTYYLMWPKTQKRVDSTGHTRQKKISTFFLNNLTCIFYVTEKSFYPFTFVSLPLYYQYKRLLIFVLHLPPKKYTHAMVLDLSQLYCHILNSYQLPSFW